MDAPARLRRPARRVRLVAARVLARLAPADGVAIRLVDRAQMTALNGAWRGKRGPTDVLSWESALPGHLGDIALCLEVAREQARALGHPLAVELAVLVVHALVHLCGMDHERSPDEARRQAEIEMGLLDALGVNPAAALSRRGL